MVASLLRQVMTMVTDDGPVVDLYAGGGLYRLGLLARGMKT
jgi:hypothetical protein